MASVSTKRRTAIAATAALALGAAILGSTEGDGRHSSDPIVATSTVPATTTTTVPEVRTVVVRQRVEVPTVVTVPVEVPVEVERIVEVASDPEVVTRWRTRTVLVPQTVVQKDPQVLDENNRLRQQVGELREHLAFRRDEEPEIEDPQNEEGPPDKPAGGLQEETNASSTTTSTTTPTTVVSNAPPPFTPPFCEDNPLTTSVRESCGLDDGGHLKEGTKYHCEPNGNPDGYYNLEGREAVNHGGSKGCHTHGDYFHEHPFEKSKWAANIHPSDP